MSSDINNNDEKNLVDNSDPSDDSKETIEPPSPPEPITKKDPKKVEQGKRLAMISKQAKERKMREKIEAEIKSEKESSSSRLSLSAPTPLLIGIPVVGTYLLYRWIFSGSSQRSKSNSVDDQSQKIVENDHSKKKIVKEPKNFETLG